MSLFRTVNATCPHCGRVSAVEAVGSINADRRPDYRDAIMQNRFQDMTCPACGGGFRLQPDFNYLDAGRGQWIAALPAAQMPRYLEAEDEVLALFAKSYGEKAPAAARSVGERLEVRLTFGWPAVREKLLLREHGLDDAVIEMVKLDLLRRLPSAPLAPGVELRVVAVFDTDLAAIWVRAGTEETIAEGRIPRAIEAAILADPEGWAPTRARLANGPFVDMQKFFMGAGREAAAAAE